MMKNILRHSALAAIILAAGFTAPGAATTVKSDVAVQAGDTDVSTARRGGFRSARGARIGRGATVSRRATVTRRATVGRSGNVSRRATVNRRTTVGRGADVNVRKRNNVDVNRRTNVNVRRTTVNVRRPVRVWAPRPYYGTIVGGVALGTIIAASATGVVPTAPGPNMCWFWADSSQTRGYWDYCQTP